MLSSTTSTPIRAREGDAVVRRPRIDIHDRRARAAKRTQATAQAIAFVAADDDDSEFVCSHWERIGWRHRESRSSLADSSGRAD